LFGHESAITTLTISPDGQRAASGGGDGRLYLWDLAAGEPKDLVKVSAGCAAAIACSSSGQIIASFSRDKRTLNLKKYNLKGQHYDGKLFIRRDQIKASIAIHPEGCTIAVGMRGSVCLYDTQTGLKKTTIGGFEGYVRLTAFSPDGSKLLAGSGYKNPRKWTIYDLQTGDLTLGCFKGERGKQRIEGVAFLPDGASFISVSYDSIELWDLGTGRCEQVGGERHNLFFTRAVAVHPIEKTFITGGYPDGNIHDWDLETGKHLRTFAAHTRRITALAFSQDGKLLLSGCEGGIVHYWDYKAGRLLATAYNVDAGYLWTTPSDAFAEEGWLYTNRTDLVSLAVIDSHDDSLEYLKEDDERFKNYLWIYNDGDMVMARIHDWERYQKLLSLRINNKEEEEFAQIEARAGMEGFYQLKAGRDSTIEKEES
jgi:WD40 repeat protein